MTTFPIAPNEFIIYAQNAVYAFVGKQFPKFFSKQEIEDMVGEVVMRMWRAQGSFDPEKG